MINAEHTYYKTYLDFQRTLDYIYLYQAEANLIRLPC